MSYPHLAAADNYASKVAAVRQSLESVHNEIKKAQETLRGNGEKLAELGACALGLKQVADDAQGSIATARSLRSDASMILASDAIISQQHPDMQDGFGRIADVANNLGAAQADNEWISDTADYESGNLTEVGGHCTDAAGGLATLLGSVEEAHVAATQAEGESRPQL